MPDFRLLALDIDGTLVNSRDELTEPVRAALRRARAAGIQVVLATGRRYRRALPLVEMLQLDVPLVTASGALIKHPADHRTLFCASFAPGVVPRMVQFLDSLGHETVLYGDTFHENFDYYCATLDTRCPELAEFLAKNHEHARIWPAMVQQPPADVFAGFVMGTRAAMVQLQTALHRQLPGALYVHVLRSPRYDGFMCEIAPSGVSKWQGIRRLAGEWGIRECEICAVGDDVNDIPMIRGAGLGVAMGNALPEVRAAADRIAPPHDADGLVQVVDWLLADSVPSAR